MALDKLQIGLCMGLVVAGIADLIFGILISGGGHLFGAGILFLFFYFTG